MGPDPTAVDDLARLVEASAGRMSALGDDLATALARAQWEGPRAERFRAAAAGTGRALEADADRLRAAGRELRIVADSMRRELIVLGDIERRVQGFFAAAARTVATVGEVPWADWPWHPGRLPGHGSPQWHEVARFLANQGHRP